MITDRVIGGSAEAGRIVFTPPPGIAKRIASRPPAAFASSMAARRVHCLPALAASASQRPSPGLASGSSATRLTVNVAAAAAGRAPTSGTATKKAARNSAKAVRDAELIDVGFIVLLLGSSGVRPPRDLLAVGGDQIALVG